MHIVVEGTKLDEHLQNSVLILNYRERQEDVNVTGNAFVYHLVELTENKAVYQPDADLWYTGVTPYWAGIAAPFSGQRHWIHKF